jgi:hypothetical protein
VATKRFFPWIIYAIWINGLLSESQYVCTGKRERNGRYWERERERERERALFFLLGSSIHTVINYDGKRGVGCPSANFFSISFFLLLSLAVGFCTLICPQWNRSGKIVLIFMDISWTFWYSL